MNPGSVPIERSIDEPVSCGYSMCTHRRPTEIIISDVSLANQERSMVYLDIGTDPVIIGGPRTFQCGGRVSAVLLPSCP
eukprot:4026405-Prymnesium_polylepis.1